jgi:hypothetical protein
VRPETPPKVAVVVPGSVSGIMCFLGPFFLAAFDLWNETPYYHRFQGRLAGVPFVKAQILGVAAYIRAFNDDGIQQGFKRGYVVPVSPGYHQGQRYSCSVSEHRAFAAVFSPGRRDSFPPFPEPGALWSYTRRRLTRSN